MSDISRIILNTMLYEINNSNTSKSVSNNESFSKLLQSSIGLLGSSSSDRSCSNSGVSSLGMIVTLTGLINQNRIYESNSNINNNLDSNNQTIQINNQNSNVNSNISASITTSVNNNTESINPNMDKAILYEKSFDFASLIEEAVNSREIIEIKRNNTKFDI